MPYNKKSGDDQRKSGGYKAGGRSPKSSDGYKGKRNDRSDSAPRKEGFKSRNSEFNTFDKDELAAPRFLPPKRTGSSGPRPYGKDGFKKDGPARDNKGRDSYRKGPSGEGRDGGYRKGPSGERRDEGFRRGPSGEKREEGFRKGPGTYGKREDNYKKRSEGGFRDRPDSGDRRDSKPRSYGDDRSSGRGPKRDGFDKKDNGFDRDKKPYRPKYDPEIKVKKSFKERKEELMGPDMDSGDMRLNKYIANAGICSRREADELIKQGLVTINNTVVTEMGYKVKKEDVVKYDGRKILPEPYVYILMNKPKDFITTTEDDKGRKTVMDLLADKVPQRVYPIGRLDRNTTGVLLLTNDGEVSQALTHPSFQIKKVYHVVLDKKVSGTDLDKLVEGIDLEDGHVHADAVSFVESEDRRHVGVEIHSGRNRVVRRMFEALGYEVEKLDRVSMGIFTKKDLPRGKWRHLNQSEIGFLMKLKSKMP
ncbi:MAG: pseudouridine synthase [Chitinophagaceae bacterium]